MKTKLEHVCIMFELGSPFCRVRNWHHYISPRRAQHAHGKNSLYMYVLRIKKHLRVLPTFAANGRAAMIAFASLALTELSNHTPALEQVKQRRVAGRRDGC